MQLEQYYTAIDDNGTVQFTREQASDFAKKIAGDFNPIHDVDAKRFCVPGDLLFTIALSKLGLSQEMHVKFSDTVTDGIDIRFEKSPENNNVQVINDDGKLYLSIEENGEHKQCPEQILKLAAEYVAFSGRTFPHILVPLWQDQNVMVHPTRPLVMYTSMSIQLDHLDFEEPHLEVGHCELNVDGKRGGAVLRFDFMDNGKKFGTGEKHMILSGLREYDQGVVDDLVSFYGNLKQDYLAAAS